jgi:hypothetical protein
VVKLHQFLTEKLGNFIFSVNPNIFSIFLNFGEKKLHQKMRGKKKQKKQKKTMGSIL